jgi:amidase
MNQRRSRRSRREHRSRVLSGARRVAFCALLFATSAPSSGAEPAPDASDSSASVRTPFEILDADIAAVQAAFAAGELSVETLTHAYLERIRRLDRSGPVLNTLIAVKKHALEEAVALDAERAASGARGPLHGIPIIVRDDLDTFDLPTTAGSATLRGNEPFADAVVVERLREAGALVLAKANLSELGLALGRWGYSSAAGQTRNPYNPRRTPSYAGEGAAVAANLAMAGVGTDTAGSLRGAAAANGVVGLKPTLGLTSRTGSVPTARSIQVAGITARSVRDVALLLGVIAAEADPADPRTADLAERPAEYVTPLEATTLEGTRLGVAQDYRGGHKQVDASFRAAVASLRKHGAVTVDVRIPPAVLDGRAGILEKLIETELKDQLDAYLVNTEFGMPHSLTELLRMSESPLIAGSETPVSPRHLATYRRIVAGPGLADLDYLDVLSRRLPAARAEVLALFSEHELDALVFPTMLCPASSLLDDYDSSYRCKADDPYQPAYLASIAGLPELTLTMGQTKRGLPLGLSMVGPAFSEARLLALGFAFEQLVDARKPPDLPEVEVPRVEDPGRDAEDAAEQPGGDG